jgi:hypothetical protein
MALQSVPGSTARSYVAKRMYTYCHRLASFWVRAFWYDRVTTMNKGLSELIPTIPAVFLLCGDPVAQQTRKLPRGVLFTELKESALSVSLARGKHGKPFGHAKTYIYRGILVRLLLATVPISILKMDPPNPTTPPRRYPRTKLTNTPNRLSAIFATSSQPVGSTQHALQASLAGNILFKNEAIVDAVFQPSKVADQTVKDILTEIIADKSLKDARDKVLNGKLAELRKYKPMVCHRMLAGSDNTDNCFSRLRFLSTSQPTVMEMPH